MRLAQLRRILRHKLTAAEHARHRHYERSEFGTAHRFALRAEVYEEILSLISEGGEEMETVEVGNALVGTDLAELMTDREDASLPVVVEISNTSLAARSESPESDDLFVTGVAVRDGKIVLTAHALSELPEDLA